jgi:hypothetical protein
MNRSFRIHVVMRWLIIWSTCRSRYVVLNVVGAKEVEAAQRIHLVGLNVKAACSLGNAAGRRGAAAGAWCCRGSCCTAPTP